MSEINHPRHHGVITVKRLCEGYSCERGCINFTVSDDSGKIQGQGSEPILGGGTEDWENAMGRTMRAAITYGATTFEIIPKGD